MYKRRSASSASSSATRSKKSSSIVKTASGAAVSKDRGHQKLALPSRSATKSSTTVEKLALLTGLCYLFNKNQSVFGVLHRVHRAAGANKSETYFDLVSRKFKEMFEGIPPPPAAEATNPPAEADGGGPDITVMGDNESKKGV